MKVNVRKNFIYNVLYQLLAIIVPLITTPYASRVLGVEGIGIYSYIYSIVYYFMIIAMLGINNYGSREIARNCQNKEILSKTFWSTFFLQLSVSSIILLVYYLFIGIFINEYKVIYVIQSLYIISSMFDINWFYYGVENFKITVTRNSIIKILSVILIIMFVKNRNDVWKYALILSGTTCFSNVILLLFLKRYIKFSKIIISDIIKPLKECLILFITIIAMKIYKVMDKTMIGIFSNVSEVGLYSNADSIINVPMGIIIALGTVMLPRLSNMIANGKKNESIELLYKTLKFAIFLSTPIMFGILAIGKDFAIIFLGKDFERTGIILRILSITIMFMTVANVLRTQYLIPNKRDKEYTYSVVFGAIVNLISNSILIRKYGAYGACIGTVLAEFIVMFMHVFFVNKDIKILKPLFKNYRFIIYGAVMYIAVIIVGNININIYYKIIIQIVFGATIYLGLNKNYILNNININKYLRRKNEEK